jgi:hypothetical protein
MVTRSIRLRETLPFALLATGLCVAFFATSVMPVLADTFTETYYLSTGGIAQSGIDGNGFKDRSPGPDLLPYTGDDEDLPPGGNAGGTWTFAVLDLDGDGGADHIFSCTRRGDDDAYTLTSYSEFHHGVFAEGEDWIDLHEANNLGPSGDGTQDVDPGDDFEWNDRPNWEGQSNWFWYNNAAANQRGLGGSKYYFELRNGPGAFDEVQGWVKTVNFQTNAGDPNIMSNSYARGSNVAIKGLLIPVEVIPDLKDGELDPLFGWYGGDMAKYVRESLGPKLEDPDLTIFETDEGGNACGTTRSLLPPTFLMIEQGEFHVTLLPGGEAAAAYWGIEALEPGGTETGAIFRWCRIMLKGDDDTYDDDGMWNPPIRLLPEEGPMENLWRRDRFVRENIQAFDPFSGTGTGLPDTWGALRLGCGIPAPDPDNTPPDHCWYFLRENDEQGLPMLQDCQQDYVLTLPGGSGPRDSWLEMPLTQVLDARKGAIRAEVEVRVKDPGAGANRIQVILTDEREEPLPVAWAEIRDDGEVHAGVGGDSLEQGGEATNGKPLTGVNWTLLSSTEGVYTRIDLLFDAGGRKIAVLVDGTEILSGSYDPAFTATEVNGLRIWTESGPGEENQVYVNDVAVFQEVLQETGQAFIRGEANCDGKTDISDAVSLLTFLFLGGSPPCCKAASDVNSDDKADISDAVALLTFLFLGGEKPGAPYPTCGVDPQANLDCESFPACP